MESTASDTEPHLAQESASPAAAAAAAAEVEVDVEKEAAAEGEEEEEEGECGFCVYMKSGGCKDAFVAWEECVEAVRVDRANLVERCFEATANLRKCMDAHADYYAPVLDAEQAVSDHADAAASVADASAIGERKGEEEVVVEKAEY